MINLALFIVRVTIGGLLAGHGAHAGTGVGVVMATTPPRQALPAPRPVPEGESAHASTNGHLVSAGTRA